MTPAVDVDVASDESQKQTETEAAGHKVASTPATVEAGEAPKAVDSAAPVAPEVAETTTPVVPKEERGGGGENAGADGVTEKPSGEGDNSIPGALTPALPGAPGLVQDALLAGVRGGDEWATTYKAMLAQAAVDVQAFAAESTRREAAFAEEEAQLKRTAAAQVAAAEQAASEARQKAMDMQAASKTARQAHLEALEAQRRKADVDQAAALKAQAAEAAAEAAARILREREASAASAAVLDEQVRALETTFAQESICRARHADAHRLAAAALALERHLRTGAPFHEALDLVRGCSAATFDPLLSAVLDSVASWEHRGVATRETLQLRLARVCDECRATALVPGTTEVTLPRFILSHVASYLRMKERPPVGPSDDTGGGVEGAMARATAAVAQGCLTGAALELERAVTGTAAEGLVAAWVADARARVRAEHALAVLRAQVHLLAAALLEPDVRE